MTIRIQVQLKKGVLELCVLALLSRGDSYGYDIAARLAEAIDMGEGTIYPLMRRLQGDGLVETYLKDLPIERVRSDVLIAYAMNGKQLPLVNGFPLRLVVPGWYSTYWIKMLCDIEVLDQHGLRGE